MLENQYNPEQLPSSTSWTIDNFKENERQRVIRKFINSAIYVEKEITEMPPQRKTSPLFDIDDSSGSSTFKKCSCASSDACCCDNLESRKSSTLCFKSHIRSSYSSSNALHLGTKDGGSKILFGQEMLKTCSQDTPESGYRTMEHSSNSSNEHSDSSSENTVKQVEAVPNSELRLSLTCLNTNRTSTLHPKERQEIVQNWLAKKELEKKRKALQETKLAKQKEDERQRLIEKERDNFKKWLADKKKEEEKKRAQKELEEEEQKLKEVEREKKKVENEINFNLWLRRKKKVDLERKITEKIALLHMYEEKQRRIDENERAYQEWLKNSKNKQKPIAPNKGLQSLCSSASVTYINPIPWTPNIDPNLKSSSQ